jgi:vacuolar protein sorting-associated protein 13A/C
MLIAARLNLVTGFVKGLGQGLVGVAAQPVSGALDFMSSAFEGIDASSNVILGKLSNQRAAKRRRLPRAIGGDRKLQPFLRSDGTDTQACPPQTSAQPRA